MSAEPDTIPGTGTYRREYGNGHQYFIDGQKVPGVTTLISNGFPKNLAKWGSECVSNYAIDNWSKLARMPLSQRLKALNGAPWADRDRGAIRGTRVHALAEQIGNGEVVTVPVDIAGYVQACRTFLTDWQVKPVASELPVFSRKHHYGGTIDLIGDMADGKRRLIDYKTNRSGAWGDMAFQLAGYRYAEFTVNDDGAESPIPEVDECGVVWLQDGEYEYYPYEVSKRVFRQFLAIMATAESVDDSRYYKGQPVAAPAELR